MELNGKIVSTATMKGSLAVGYKSSSDYETLTNKPSINNVELTGNQTGETLGLVNTNENASFKEIQDLIDSLM